MSRPTLGSELTNNIYAGYKELMGDMGRRRRKVLRQTHKTLPKVFSCPRCGMVAVRITSQLDETSHDYVTVVACGHCTNPPTRKEYRFMTEKPHIDVYNMFVDDFVKSGG